MRLFLDTSAMVKLFVEEPGSEAMSGRVEEPGAEMEGLRTLDAIQLAGYSWLVGEDGSVFASADSRLCRIAGQRGYAVFNPEEDG